MLYTDCLCVTVNAYVLVRVLLLSEMHIVCGNKKKVIAGLKGNNGDFFL